MGYGFHFVKRGQGAGEVVSMAASSASGAK